MIKTKWMPLACTVLATAVLMCCSDDDKDSGSDKTPPAAVEKTPASLSLSFLSRYSSNEFGVSAAEIPAFDAASKRAFVVNARKGMIDVLDLSDPANPRFEAEISADVILSGALVNSVAVQNDLVAVAIEAPVKTDEGFVAIFNASDLALRSSIKVGALPDMLTFTPDGKTLLVANEGEPAVDYAVDPEGSISIIDVTNPDAITEQRAGFAQFDAQADHLRAQGVRIYGPNATPSINFEPEYITVSSDGLTAWAALQENNAFAKIDIARAQVTDIYPLGYKDHGIAGNGLDVSDSDSGINIKPWAGVFGMFQPDAIGAFEVDGDTYLISANEGDARAWGEDSTEYLVDLDESKGFIEELRVKHLINANGWAGRLGDDLPAHLNSLAEGAFLNADVFAYCGATLLSPGDCRDDENLGRLKISWVQGYQRNNDGSPKFFDKATGAESETGTFLKYDTLYAYGTRSFSIWDAQGQLVWDSGDAFEQFIASDDCKLGKDRNINCAQWFNSQHDEGSSPDGRSTGKGPEPEGLTVGKIGDKTFVFVGLERMGGVMVYDISAPSAPIFVDYINTREDWATEDPSTVLGAVGDLGPEGLVFVPSKDSPTAEPLLIVGNEVSGTTAIFKVNLTY